MIVFVEPARSALPPMSQGICSARPFRTSPDAARVAIRVEGKTAAPRAPEVPAVDGLRVRVLGPSRNSYTFYDGRRLVEQVGVQYVLELRPTRAGVFEVPPFSMWTGTREQRTPALRLEARLAVLHLGELRL